MVISWTRPASIFRTASPGIAKLIWVRPSIETATPTTRPLTSTTGPPELPGFIPPLTWTRCKAPALSRRRLETDEVLTVIALPSVEPNGNPKT